METWETSKPKTIPLEEAMVHEAVFADFLGEYLNSFSVKQDVGAPKKR